jgi:hypothetical protein
MISEVASVKNSIYQNNIEAWLSPPDPSTNLNQAREQHHPGTGNWFLESEAYLAWRSEQNSFLWLNGIPGCGKTILSSSVVVDLEQNAASSPNLLYFFFDFNDVGKQSPGKAVRSLIFQLYYKRKDIRQEADALYSSCNNGDRQPDHRSLYTLFQNMMKQAGEIWIVLDALDECHIRNEGSAYGLISWIRSLRDLDLNIHVLVTSRPEQDIKSAIESWARDSEIISLQSILVQDDIYAYIKARTKQIYRWQTMPAVQNDIETALSQNADGM